MKKRNQSSLIQKAMQALADAVAKVVEDHRRRAKPLAVWRDGKAVWMSVSEAGVLRECPTAYRTKSHGAKSKARFASLYLPPISRCAPEIRVRHPAQGQGPCSNAECGLQNAEWTVSEWFALNRLPILTWIMFLKFLDDLELQREGKAKLTGKQRIDTSPWPSPRSRRRGGVAIGPPYRWRDWAVVSCALLLERASIQCWQKHDSRCEMPGS